MSIQIIQAKITWLGKEHSPHQMYMLELTKLEVQSIHIQCMIIGL